MPASVPVRPLSAPAGRLPRRASAPVAAVWRVILLALGGWAALALPAMAGTLDLQISNAAGQPLAGAVVFLESREAKAASRPATGVEIVQINRQFSPNVTVVPADSAVPTGAYRLRTWHPSLPPGAATLDQPLRVPAAGPAQARVTLAEAQP